MVGRAYARLRNERPVRISEYSISGQRFDSGCLDKNPRWYIVDCFLRLPDGEEVFMEHRDIGSDGLIEMLNRKISEKYLDAVL